ncbi:glycosyltransferase family 10 (fucosyltransferase) c-term domain-containing protein [Phthorimaea operculella]|nr:glycosyltransferase family 10 (fucosyltransferase) c-term domain-containing protein [Phthorimaea operculella]
MLCDSPAFLYALLGLVKNSSEEDIKVNEYSDKISDVEDFGNEVKVHETIVRKYYEKRKTWKTSNLGSILFKNVDHQQFIREDQANKTFLILFWQHWAWQKNRHVYNYGSNDDVTRILEDCSVKNCEFTGDDKEIDSADAVIIHMQKKRIPVVEKRNTKQRWIFLSDESPINIFSLGRKSNLSWTDMNNVFNWTMTYRSDSDVPVPYGRTVPLHHPLTIDHPNPKDMLQEIVPYWKDKEMNSRAMVLTSHCVKARMRFIQELQEFVQVDVFGGCSDKPENKKKCPGHFKADCMLPASYLFYLVLENSKCSQYITEKVFQHAFSKGAIPVIMGPSLKDCEDLLPPNSFMHVENYENIEQLSEAMKEISRSDKKILNLHAWRKHFGIANEHGYFKTKSFHLCRVCEALNYNDKNVKVYTKNDLDTFFNMETLCDLKYFVVPGAVSRAHL